MKAILILSIFICVVVYSIKQYKPNPAQSQSQSQSQSATKRPSASPQAIIATPKEEEIKKEISIPVEKPKSVTVVQKEISKPEVKNVVIEKGKMLPQEVMSLEEFKKLHPEVGVSVTKIKDGEMLPEKLPTLEEFKKNNPGVEVKVEKLP